MTAHVLRPAIRLGAVQRHRGVPPGHNRPLGGHDHASEHMARGRADDCQQDRRLTTSRVTIAAQRRCRPSRPARIVTHWLHTNPQTLSLAHRGRVAGTDDRPVCRRYSATVLTPSPAGHARTARPASGGRGNHGRTRGETTQPIEIACLANATDPEAMPGPERREPSPQRRDCFNLSFRAITLRFVDLRVPTMTPSCSTPGLRQWEGGFDGQRARGAGAVLWCAPGRPREASATISDQRKRGDIMIEYRAALPPK